MPVDPYTLPTTEDLPDGPTSLAKIERVLQALRTRQAGHLSGAIELIEALRQERDRRRTALNVLAVVVSLLLDQDQTAALTGTDALRHALLQSALERAVLALYPAPIAEAIHAGDPPPMPRGDSPTGTPDGATSAGVPAQPDDGGATGSTEDVSECQSTGTAPTDQSGDRDPGESAPCDDEWDARDPTV